MNRKALAVPLSLLLLIPVVLWAAGRGQPVTNQGRPDAYVLSDVSTVYRSALDGGDPTDVAGGTTGQNISAITTANCGGYQTVTVSGHFSVASATCVVTLVRGHWDGSTWTTKSLGTATLSAGATYTVSSKYLSTDSVSFDTNSCSVFKVLAADPSSGTVDLWLEVH